MTDLVEQARAIGREYWQHKRYYDALAAEIERLRQCIVGRDAEIERLRVEIADAMSKCERTETEIERLQTDKAAISQTASDYLHELGLGDT